MDTQTPADDSVRQEFIDMYEDTLVDLMEKNGDAPLTEDAESRFVHQRGHRLGEKPENGRFDSQSDE